jgi:hypothetical protein
MPQTLSAALSKVLEAESAPRWQSRRAMVLTPPAQGRYSRTVSVKKIQVGQVWKRNDNGESFLVTKVYSEALATFAVLRKAGSETEPPVRVKVSKTGAAASLPGYSYTQESGDF